MNILYLHQHFTTRSGSTGTRSYEMARALCNAGHKVHMVCGSFQVANSGLDGPYENGKRSGTVDGIEVTELEIHYANKDSFLKRAWAFASFAARSVKVVFGRRYDLVFATSTPLTAGIPGIFAKWMRRTPFIFEVRDLWPELPREMGVIKNPIVLAAMSALEKASYFSANACIGLSPGIVEGIERRSASEKRVAMIPNGCDVELFARSEAYSATHAYTKSNPFTAIFCGAHGLANGLDAVLDVAAVLKQRNIENIKILFIGEGREKERLITRAQMEGLDNCEFRSAIPKTELVRLLHSVQLGLMILDNVPAFYHGTSPNKFFDYIASGLPVLTNYPGWLASLIGEHKMGVAVPPDAPNEFADAMVAMASNPDEMIGMSEKAIECAKVQFNRESLASEFVGFLETMDEQQ